MNGYFLKITNIVEKKKLILHNYHHIFFATKARYKSIIRESRVYTVLNLADKVLTRQVLVLYAAIVHG